MNNIVKIIFYILLILCMVGCNGVESEEIFTNEQLEIMTELNEPLDILKENITDFILNVYMPIEGVDKEKCIEPIKKYLSISEYNNLIAEMVGYNNVNTSVQDLKIRYGLAKNNMDNCDKILCSFYLVRYLDSGTVRNRIALVFSIRGGQITHHTIYTGKNQIKIN